MCKSCGSNIQGTKLHLCSIKTSKEWRREVPLHLRRGDPIFKGSAKLTIDAKEDRDLYEKWLEEHKNADAIVCDTRTGLVIQAIYDNPVGITLSENLDAFVNIINLDD